MKLNFADGVPIEHATLHVASPVKYAGTEQTLSEHKIPGLKMSLFPQGLVVRVKCKQNGPEKYGYTLFPSAGVKAMWVEMEDKAKVDKK